MLTVHAAMEMLIETIPPFGVVEVPLSESFGMVLARDVNAVTDLPLFDKSLMDGYAVRLTDVISGAATLNVIELVVAGQVAKNAIGPGQAIQIMTGAPLPSGTDLVVKVEETRRDQDVIVINTKSPVAGANVIRRGTSVRAGASVLSAGLKINGARIGAMAELGCVSVPVRRRPRVAILATGDELVRVEETPGPGQIRNSNESMLAAQVQAAGGIAVCLGIARDNKDDLKSKIDLGLKCDVFLLSGGVSAGTLDLVPSVLAESGVREVFHKVEMKPGKPIWFGVKSEREGACAVFGLPGNPVSSLVCCELFVHTAIRRLMGVEPIRPQPISAALEHDYSSRHDRPTYHPARLTWTTDGLAVTLVPWHGSSDLCGTVAANGMAYLRGEQRQYRLGDHLETFAW